MAQQIDMSTLSRGVIGTSHIVSGGTGTYQLEPYYNMYTTAAGNNIGNLRAHRESVQ